MSSGRPQRAAAVASTLKTAASINEQAMDSAPLMMATQPRPVPASRPSPRPASAAAKPSPKPMPKSALQRIAPRPAPKSVINKPVNRPAGNAGATPAAAASGSGAAKKTPQGYDCPLFMDCSEEVLSEAQKTGQSRALASFKDQMSKLEAIAKKGAAMQRHENGSVTLR